ncbi:glucose-6-phosphate dehydrogenase [Modestobacter sp. NPDC049651]|uniref:glucose-6-phosphate dehydrogenase n=1 Tax=unclassified Modestobacter TaxID=2643866 RepID=UPI0033C823D9
MDASPASPALSRLLLLGATGDLAGRFLLPALAGLPDPVQVVGAAPAPLDDAGLRAAVDPRLAAAGVPADARAALLGRLRGRPVDLTDPATVAAAVRAAAGEEGAPIAVYLALPPAAFPPALTALRAAGLPAGSRIAVEKPFGADLASARALNALLAEVAGSEPAAFRVDHALGMPAAQALLDARAPGGPLAGLWDAAHLAQVDLLWEEGLGLEGRAAFYDRTGTVRDVVQNHVLQVLTLATMELPGTADAVDLHRAKLDLLRAVRLEHPDDPGACTRRARYTAGTLPDGRRVPDYATEDGVDPARGTETYAELVLRIDTPRWAGTRFVLRAGKGLDGGRTGVALHLRAPLPGDLPVGRRTAPDRLWLGLNEDGGQGGELDAYRRVLADVLGGGDRTSVSAAEAEASWQVVDPVLAAWRAGTVPLLEYPAGSAGPGLLGG